MSVIECQVTIAGRSGAVAIPTPEEIAAGSAAAAKIEELLTAHPKATDAARFKMFQEWLEDNPEHRAFVIEYFVRKHLPPSYRQ